MAKVKWGGDLTQEDVDNADVGGGMYSGPMPRRGWYQFKLSTMQQAESKAGGPKLYMVWKLDGSFRPTDKKFDGCPLFDHMPIGKSSAFRTRALCDALGVSAADFLGKTSVDGDKNIIKIGKLTIREGMTVFINVRTEDDEKYGERLILNGAGYMSPPDDADADDDDDDDDDSGDAPF